MFYPHVLAFLLAQYSFGGAPIDGIECQSMEGAALHIHAHLQLIENRLPEEVPANVGIPIGGSCLYWLHTHATDGLIHVEAPVRKTFTLGQFFDIWGETLSWTEAAMLHAPHGARLRITVNGTPYTGRDPGSIPLRDREEIVIQQGPAYVMHPAAYPWGAPQGP
ncbi:MAG: hypothetical protein JOZ38_11615 [Candidatus Eremiobacteraeota bacterium]|nr:hypothetical protein [Candidatus Eremiobacteraeota bacterium]